MSLNLVDVIVTLFLEAEHDFQRMSMWMTLREALGYGHNMGGLDYEDDVDWEREVRALVEDKD